MKDSLVYVTDPATLEAVERNDFHSPVPAQIVATGAWVYSWSMEQFRIHCLESELNP